jgi:hypothetical protein
VRGVLENADATLLPGVFVRVRIPMSKPIPNTLLVPDRALAQDQAGQYVLVLDGSDTVQRRSVQPGELLGNLRVISSGLAANDRVVVGDLWRAQPGTKAQPQMMAIDANAASGYAAPNAATNAAPGTAQ